MADFCRQCSITQFGEDFRELAEISTPEDTRRGVYARVICEGCGFRCLVNHEGVCVSLDCLEKHGEE